jgi:hypothetical protein
MRNSLLAAQPWLENFLLFIYFYSKEISIHWSVCDTKLASWLWTTLYVEMCYLYTYLYLVWDTAYFRTTLITFYFYFLYDQSLDLFSYMWVINIQWLILKKVIRVVQKWYESCVKNIWYETHSYVMGSTPNVSVCIKKCVQISFKCETHHTCMNPTQIVSVCTNNTSYSYN